MNNIPKIMELSERLSACEKDPLDEPEPEPELLNLTTIIDDCKVEIFQYLQWQDLMSIAETNKQLYAAVCLAFRQKYGTGKVYIFQQNYRYFIFDRS